MILFLLLFNGFVLWLVLEMVAGFFVPAKMTSVSHGAKAAAVHAQNAAQQIASAPHIHSLPQFFNYYHEYINIALAVLIVCGLVWLFYSGVGQWFLRFICGARKPIEREKKRIYPVVDRVQQAIKINLGIEVVDKVNLMIVDASVPNAAAVGKNTLIIERSLYETCNDEELAGVIAHEMGHLHNGDSVRLGVALGVSTITLAISSTAVFLFSVVSIVSNLFSRGKEETSIFAVVFGFVFMLFLWIFLLCIKGGNWIIDLALLFQGRKQEYKADEFAVKAGFGDGLLSFLEKIKDFYMDGRRTIADKLYATHPPVMLRIGKLEEYLKTDE